MTQSRRSAWLDRDLTSSGDQQIARDVGRRQISPSPLHPDCSHAKSPNLYMHNRRHLVEPGGPAMAAVTTLPR